ncbi:MAG: ThuA domain-containing protein [Actinomycetota bacterium]
MNRRDLLTGLGTAAVGAGLSQFPLGWAQAADAPKRRILFFTKSSGFEHPAIKQVNGQPSFAEKVLQELGARHNFEVTHTKDGSVFTPEGIAKYDAFFFYTTGDLTTAGTDKNPPMSREGKAAFLDAIKNGKGYIGTHSASDTFHTPPETPDRANRYINHGEASDPYIRMLGGEFIKHGPQQVAKMTVTDGKFPGLSSAGSSFELMEEWYSLKDFAPNLHVILVNETAGMKGAEYQRGPFPATWARMHGKGRVFYTSMGHRDDVWTNPLFQSILMGGLSWAVGNIKADVTPNLAKVCPTYAELPPKPA